MPDSLPRIGSQNLLTGLKKLLQIIRYKNNITPEELKQEMELIDQNRETKLFSTESVKKAWLDFTLNEKNRSIEVLDVNEKGKVELTEEGRNLISASDFYREAFNLFRRKSSSNFNYFYKTLQEIDKKVKSRDFDMRKDLTEKVNSLMKHTPKGNRVTAQAVASFLKGFELVKKEGNMWKINPARYAYLKGEDTDLILGIIEEHDGKITMPTLKKIALKDLEWNNEKFDKIIGTLKKENKIHVDRYGGKTIIHLSV